MCATTGMGGLKEQRCRSELSSLYMNFRDDFWLKGFKSLSQFSVPGPKFHLSCKVLGFFSLHQISTQVYVEKALTKRLVREHTTL